MQPFKEALKRVHEIAGKKGSHILHTSEVSRHDRTLLTHNGWLEEIIRGWYLFVRPASPAGDSTAWYASFWDFLKIYLQHHYGLDYCLSAECSLDFYVGNTVVPKQVIIMAHQGSGKNVQLLHGTSLLVYAVPSLPEEREVVQGIQVMSLSYALCKVNATYFQCCPLEAETALRAIPSTSDLLRTIVQNNFKAAAERLVGAYRQLGDNKRANEIKSGLMDVGIIISETNPFAQDNLQSFRRSISPYVARLHVMWDRFRSCVIEHFPPPPGLPKNRQAYLTQVAEKYELDAYNSLSIEGYQVSKELIEKVMQAKWAPESDLQDRLQKDALAARGYYEAHLLVKTSVEKILKGESPGEVIKDDLQQWYQKLFSTSVQVGILTPAELFGYRRHQVYIRQSRHTPPAKEYLVDLMDALFLRLKEEEHAAVRAVLGHFIFVYIHPYMDGNGRLGRFLMNAMLASGGYPWTIVKVAHRNQYIAALEAASAHDDIVPFVKFIASEMKQEKP